MVHHDIQDIQRTAIFAWLRAAPRAMAADPADLRKRAFVPNRPSPLAGSSGTH